MHHEGAGARPMEIYDISQVIREGIPVWPGDVRFRHHWTMRIREGESANVSAVTLSVHTGTHLDAPLHYSQEGADVGSVGLKCCVGPARVFDLTAEAEITPQALEKLDWQGVERALFKTRCSDLPDNRFYRDYPPITPDAARFLGERRLLLVGTDAPSVDAFTSRNTETHKALLGLGILLVEGLRLKDVPAGDFELICLPLRFAGLDGSPVRAILKR
jgi:arylformamidase